MIRTYCTYLSKLIFVIAAPICLNSCESNTYVTYYLDNQSSDTIFVSGKNIVYATKFENTILPLDRKNIASWSKFGKQSDLFEPSAFFGNDLIITNTQGDTLKKDYKKVSNWLSEVNEAPAVVLHDYTLVINDVDF